MKSSEQNPFLFLYWRKGKSLVCGQADSCCYSDLVYAYYCHRHIGARVTPLHQTVIMSKCFRKC